MLLQKERRRYRRDCRPLARPRCVERRDVTASCCFAGVVHEYPRLASDGDSEEASFASDERDDVISPVKVRMRQRRFSAVSRCYFQFMVFSILLISNLTLDKHSLYKVLFFAGRKIISSFIMSIMTREKMICVYDAGHQQALVIAS